jgi:hypothetical protein
LNYEQYSLAFLQILCGCECSNKSGSYASLSPTLSARLCNGNGEFMKHEEENLLPDEAVFFQRQEMH